MPTKVVKRGRIVWRSDPRNRFRRPPELPRGRDGQVLDGSVVPPEQRPYRAGYALYDSDEQVVYRCVKSFDPLGGWATTELWQERWSVDHKAICVFCRAGRLDAIVVEGSMVRRYRCRDEHGLRKSSLFRKQRMRRVQAEYWVRRGKENRKSHR
jgi:hypothetical protein